MAQALIQPYMEGIQGAAIAPLYDPRFARSARRRFHRPLIPEMEKANGIYVSSGLWPTRAWILVRRADYNNINAYATNLQLQIDDFQSGTLTLQNLAIVQARCVTRGLPADPDAIYLVELTDLRGLVYNQYFQWPVNVMYNVRAPAYPDDYYEDSLNAGNPWTWDEMLEDLWNRLTPLGDYPGLPITPTTTVEGFTYSGVSGWAAINQILDLLGCAVAVDLTTALDPSVPSSPYSIVDLSQTDDIFTDLQTAYLGRLEDDWEYLDLGVGRVPAEVVVFFQRRNEYYGTEETIRLDTLQWSSTPLYSVTVSAPAAFSNAVGQHYLFSEFTVRYDIDNNPLSADVTTAATVAQQRATEYYNRLTFGQQGSLRQVYAGALPFKTGSQCWGVKWTMDFQAHEYKREDDPVFRMMAPEDRPETRQEGRLSWRTTLCRGPWPAWDEVKVDAE